MDSFKVVKSTDKFCNFIYTESNTYRYRKEAFINISTYKKVEQPALVKIIKKCAKIKKAGLHPIGIKTILRFILYILKVRSAWALCPKLISVQAKQATSASWSQKGLTNNKLFKMINGNKLSGYNIGLWNCRRGLLDSEKKPTTKMSEVKNFLQQYKLHILCLLEADLHGATSRYKRLQPLSLSDIESSIGIPGYKLLLPQSWYKHGQARVLVIAKEELQVKLRNLGNQNSDLQTLICEIGLAKEKKTIVSFFYREFTGGVSGLRDMPAQVERWSRQIKLWRNLCGGNKDVLCLGDANLCADKWNEESFPQKELAEVTHNFLLDTGSSQVVNGITRTEVGPGGVLLKSCIDHCYTNVPEKVAVPELVHVGNSDHLGIVVKKISRAAQIKPKIIQKRSYKCFIIENFLNDVHESQLNEKITACDDLEEAAKIFEEDFRTILDKHAPIKKFQVRKNYLPYVSDETKLLFEERKVLKEESIRTDDVILEKEAKRLGKEIKKSLIKDEKDYFENKFGENVDITTAWKTANEIMGRNKNLAPLAIKHTNENGEHEVVTNPKNLAEMFNSFFKKKVETLRSKTNQPPTIQPAQRLKSWLTREGINPPPFHLKEIDKNTFRGIMKKMKSKRTHGLDWIDSFSLKAASPLIEDSLIHLINLSIRRSKFSTRWKPQLIFPTHKKKEKDKLENYRPVSHLVQVGIMVEYAAYFQIVDHFTQNNLFHPNHHGSLAHHSTATAIIQLFDTLLEATEKQELSAVCLLDQSAAYDLLCHQTLEEKLKIYNFDQSSVKWVMSYLGHRSQLVQVEASCSTELPGGDHAAPQGSVLGGLLHVINSNDFPACHENGDSIVYVDDDSDIVHHKDPATLRALIETEARNSASWLRDNRLCVAADKSKLLICGTRKLKANKEPIEMKIEVEGETIEESESEKLLGVVLNNKLTWKNHLYGDKNNQGLIPQLSTRIGTMKLLSKFMTREKLQYFANGIFYSKLTYCLAVFGNVFNLDKFKEKDSRHTSFTKNDNHRLQVLQNRLNRLLVNADYKTPTAELLTATGSLSIQQLIAYQTAVMAYKISQSKKPHYLHQKLITNKSVHDLRGRSDPLQQPGYKLSLSREAFLYRASSILNMMSVNLRNETKLETFKAKAKEWVKKNIAIKPIKETNLIQRNPRRPLANQDRPNLNQQNSIRRYFQPIAKP